MKKYVIVGASAAGISALNRIYQLDSSSHITCISDEVSRPYNKCFLADYGLKIKTHEQLYIMDPSKYDPERVVFIQPARVIDINTTHCSVYTQCGKEIKYDILFIGSGARPLCPVLFDKISSDKIFHFYSLHDVDRLCTYINTQRPRRALVVGAGLSGIECADVLQSAGVQTFVCERNSLPLAGGLDELSYQYIYNAAKNSSVEIYTNAHINHVLERPDGEVEVHTLDKVWVVDIVIIAVGTKPNTDFISCESSIILENGRIVVDGLMRTTVSNVYAGGDVIMTNHMLTGDRGASTVWPDAMLHGTLAAYAMMDKSKPYPGIFPIVSSAFFGIKYASVGVPQLIGAETKIVCINSGVTYRAIWVNEHGHLRAFIECGPQLCLSRLRQLMVTKTSVTPEILRELSV
ncbi:hypothetical protein J120_03910 [candidate division TM6 bacterium JCVI TM6SC1]|uniref:FAD/NAD(P)-binding domain-containing protein n=1 Tax=candidate division TM6 bacterium JCVI TM6SC1 TaxID=1306947 RepID=A0A0D2I1G0_9BACT|nr:hypothetical protein J120_03910 [candidate division TM6 bacterium JCVI TM6SC1]